MAGTIGNRALKAYTSIDMNATNNNINNGFIVRFGVRRRHRGPPFARGYHQFIIIGGKQGRRDGVADQCIF